MLYEVITIEVMSTTKFISGGAAAVSGAVIDNGIFDWSRVPALSKWYDKFKNNAFLFRTRKEILYYK